MSMDCMVRPGTRRLRPVTQ